MSKDYELDDSFIRIVNENHDRVVEQRRREEQARSEQNPNRDFHALKRSPYEHRPTTLKRNSKYNKMTPKNLNIRRKTIEIVKGAAAVGGCLILVWGGYKLLSTPNAPVDVPTEAVVAVNPEEVRTIGIEDCDFSNVHIILRAAKNETIGVTNVCHDEFEALGVSNERINNNADIVEVVQNAKEAHPGCEIVVINVETGVERTDNYRTIIMTDGTNDKVNTADTLVACMNTSFREYSLSPDVRSGKMNSEGRRTETSIEKKLREAGLEEGVTQFTVDLTTKVGSDEITRNDSASAIVEGAMRWAAIPEKERHMEVYYMVRYGDTLSEIAEKYHTSVSTLKSLSDLWDTTNLGAYWTVTVNKGPMTASTSAKVDNPAVTSNPNDVNMVSYSHIVESGDTLSEIADEYGVPMSSIQTRSGNPDNIQIGEVLNINKPDHILTSPKADLSETIKITY